MKKFEAINLIVEKLGKTMKATLQGGDIKELCGYQRGMRDAFEIVKLIDEETQ